MHALPLQWNVDIKSVGHAPAVYVYEASNASVGREASQPE